jgi:UPF0716 family protein affecting phage T7 exclusion
MTMETEEKREKKLQDGKLSGEKLLTGALYIMTALCILGFIGQSIATMFIVP